MGKKSAGKEKGESREDSAGDCIDAPNEALGGKPCVNVDGRKDENKKKRKLQLDLAEILSEDRKKGKRAKYDGEASESSDKERKKDKMGDKRGLELGLIGKENEFLKVKEIKDASEASDICNEKERRKDRKKKKRRDKHGAENVGVEEVSNDPHMKDNNKLDDAEVSEVGYDKKKKDKKSKKDENDVEPNGVQAVSRDTNVRKAEKGSKKSKRTRSDVQASGVSEAPNDEQKSRMKTIDLQTRDTEEKNEKKRKGNVDLGCEKNKKKKDRKKKEENDVVPNGVLAAPRDAHVKETEKSSKKGKRTKSDTEASGVSEAAKDEQNGRIKHIDLLASGAEEKNIKKKKKVSGDLGVALQESEAEKPIDASCGTENSSKCRMKKAKSVKKVSDEKNLRTNTSKNSLEKKTLKRVSFSDQVEIFPSSDGEENANEDGPFGEDNANEDGKSYLNNAGKDGLVRGKRFTPEEDEMVKKAVFGYIEQHGLGEEGVDKVLHCKEHKLKNVWRDIGASLPWRPNQSIYYRAHMLFEQDESRKWTADDYELVRKFHEQHGSDWKTLANAIGKYRVHVKDTWRRIKLPNLKSGHWSQDEYQTLFDLVNTDLRMKAFEERISKHGMIRDNICWSTISDKLATRSDSFCCTKWYDQLTSSMVAEGAWADTDDYRLLDALEKLDACSMEDVDWDNLVEDRPGEVCRKRWNQMVNHLGYLGIKSFAEQVEVLSQRYCVDVLEAREAYDSRTAIDS